MKRLKIAILGSRGIPGNYGGFETCAEELSTRLAQRGHQVTVYGCKGYGPPEPAFYKGVRRIILPTIRVKSLEKILFSVLSLLHVTFLRMDVVLMLGVSASAFCFIPRLLGAKVVINVDGLEWQRKKWGRIASWYLRFSEKAACWMTHRVVTDALCVQDYYRRQYHQETTYIPYGVEPVRIPPDGTLKALGVAPGNYVLFVSRFDPENNPLLVRRAFEKVRTDKKLVMLGDAPYAPDYIREVKDTQDPRIVFPGAIYGQGYRELQSHALCYVQATEVGGTHPALVEAMGYGHCVIANDVPEHREVLREAGMIYNGTEADLAQRLQEVLDHPDLLGEYRERVRKQAEQFTWDRIVDQYEDLFRDVKHHAS
ncbi:MAG: DUF1972 domain-containing protein [Nitrospirae bacterium]|nr:DUF1972 domain-containing protein [Nitrospirota bacterium]